MTPPLVWDMYCRVVDNFGDVGVCWRLACNLAGHGQQVRLLIDDARALTWMAPRLQAGVSVLPWAEAPTPGDVVVETFGCDPPPAVVRTMAAAQPAPVWINLEHLSAETYVERSHGLPSPQPGGLVKWFFYPGFTPRTGGLLRDADLLDAQSRFDRTAWLTGLGIASRPGERIASLFCYASPAVPALLAALALAAGPDANANARADAQAHPTLLLLTPGPAQQQVAATVLPQGLRTAALPWLTQHDFDHLLWASDLNFVRGEDSLVRALWAGKPFVWQAYPQHDGAHHRKVDALIDCFEPTPLPATVQALWRAWNGAHGAAMPAAGLPALGDAAHAASWAGAVRALRSRLLAQPDLAAQLLHFALGKRVSA